MYICIRPLFLFFIVFFIALFQYARSDDTLRFVKHDTSNANVQRFQKEGEKVVKETLIKPAVNIHQQTDQGKTAIKGSAIQEEKKDVPLTSITPTPATDESEPSFFQNEDYDTKFVNLLESLGEFVGMLENLNHYADATSNFLSSFVHQPTMSLNSVLTSVPQDAAVSYNDKKKLGLPFTPPEPWSPGGGGPYNPPGGGSPFGPKIPWFMDIPTALLISGNFKVYGILKEANLTERLNRSNPGPFTVFAPNTMAFWMLPPDQSALSSNTTYMSEIADYWVLDGYYKPEMLTNDLCLPTWHEGVELRFNVYHAGTVQTVNGHEMVAGSITEAVNGVIVSLNQLILTIPNGTIADILGNSTTLTLLYKIFNESDTLDFINGETPFTLFAPSDIAIQAMPPGWLTSLLNNTDRLLDLLEYHLVPSTFFTIGLEVGTLENSFGSLLNITSCAKFGMIGSIGVDESCMLDADIQGLNGVIHIIDGVLLPPPTPAY